MAIADWRRLHIILISAVVATACGGSTATPAANATPSPVQHAGLTIDGQGERTYRLFVPPSLDLTEPAPLLVALTGYPMNADDLADLSDFDRQASTGGFIVVYPDHLQGSSWNAGSCCGSVDDVTFISRLLDRLTSDFRIDKRRIFAAGFSAGAMMAYRLACEMSDRIAAIASVSGAMVVDNCRTARSISILEMHGSADPLVPYNGGTGDTGLTVPSTSSVIQRWVTLDGCPGQPTHTVNGITNTSTWSGCQGGTVVRFDTVSGGLHRWFGEAIDPIPGEPNSTAEIWTFFKSR